MEGFGGTLVEQPFFVVPAELLLLSSLFVTWRMTKMMTRGMRSSVMLRIVRLRFLRFSASCIASRRASRFWRWRSRLVALGTAGESTDVECGGRIRRASRYHGPS